MSITNLHRRAAVLARYDSDRAASTTVRAEVGQQSPRRATDGESAGTEGGERVACSPEADVRGGDDPVIRSPRRPTRADVTFEFGHLLDPIGHHQAPGLSRSAPADAATPALTSSNLPPGAPGDDRETSFDADAWLFDLLTEPAPGTVGETSTPPGTAADPHAAPAQPGPVPVPVAPPVPRVLPSPLPGTRVPDLPAPGRPVVAPPVVAPPVVTAPAVLAPAPEAAPVPEAEVPAVEAAVVAPVAELTVTEAPAAPVPTGYVADQATAPSPVDQGRSRFAATRADDDRLPVRRRR
jgi:hypothetical protein